MSWKVLAKYFIHGIAFSILFLILGIVSVSDFTFLVAIGPIIGLIGSIVGIGVLFLIVGYINRVVTDQLWFSVKTSFLNTLFHGLALYMWLLMVDGIFMKLPSLVFPGTATTLTTLFITTFLNGFVGKIVAGWWKK